MILQKIYTNSNALKKQKIEETKTIIKKTINLFSIKKINLLVTPHNN